MEKTNRLWRDMYYLFHDQFKFKESRISDDLILTRVDVASLLEMEYGKCTYSLSDIETLLKKYFERIGSGFVISRQNYFLLIHEIHDPALPAELLPPNYKKPIIKTKQ